jgi:hypothetical protein
MKIVKHLEKNQIQRYRNSQLNPLELLEFDDHVTVCDACRFMILQKNDLDNLYNSFTTISAPKESPREHFNFADLFTNWNLRLAFVMTAILSVFGISLYLVSRNSTNKQPILSAIEPENVKKDLGETLTEDRTQTNLQTKNEIAKKTIKPNLSNNLPEPQAKLSSSKSVKKAALPKPVIVDKKPKETALSENLRLTVKDTETDKSQTLGSESAEKTLPSEKLNISVKNREISVKIEAESKGNKYEFYLAEMPKFLTTLRKTSSRNSWKFSQTKLKKNTDYVLQVTFNQENGEVQTIKKILSLKNQK